jgi:hypothetical protein
MIVEAIGDLFCSQHGVSMCQVNPNKASKEKTKIMLPNDKNNALFFQRLIKQSKLFETSHATEKITKHTIKKTSSTTYKSLGGSLHKLLLVPLFCIKLNFSLFQHHSNLFEENQYIPEVQIHLDAKIKQDLNKNQGEKCKLNPVAEKENTH